MTDQQRSGAGGIELSPESITTVHDRQTGSIQRFSSLLHRPQGAVLSVLLILASLWAARYLHSDSFGFYEDDYTIVVRAMASSWDQIRAELQDLGGLFARQGRPLYDTTILLLAHAVGRQGTVAPAYRTAFAIVGLNSVLFYALLRRAAGPSLALLGGLSYALFSGDTTQAFLDHALGLQQSLTYLLLASLAYLSQRRVVSYVLAAGSLLSYESAFPVFLAVPLLEPIWDRDWIRRVGRHVVLGLLMMGLLVTVRFIAGEGRVLDLTPSEALAVPLVHALKGPPVALGSYLLRPVQTLLQMDGEIAVASLIGFAVYWPVLGLLLQPKHTETIAEFVRHVIRDPRSAWRNAPARGTESGLAPGSARLVRLIVTGLIMMGLSYLLTFTVRPYAISGRDTRVHLAAGVGAALTWSSGWYLLFSLAVRERARRVLIPLLAAVMSLLVGFGVIVQRDYTEAWALQRHLWSSLESYVPDLTNGSTVFIDPDGLIDTHYIDANSWNLPLVMQYVYGFPDDWERKPQVYRLSTEWMERSLHNSVEIKALDYSFRYVVRPWSQVILLSTADGRVTDRRTEVSLGGDTFALEEQPAGDGPAFEPGYLYQQLVHQTK